MINPINTSASASYAVQASEPQKNSDTNSKVQKSSLPIIATLGEQSKVSGDRAYAACYAACVAASAAATLSPVGIALCFNGCLPFAVGGLLSA
ncbi:MAG TPA: hypothetical protein VGZ69_05710 [Candidatus Rhabdochlamydia sp.]|jgi:hypothetical protein|nr:hypothetical protein [Candidatus Rhabdochlamydia sp.]